MQKKCNSCGTTQTGQESIPLIAVELEATRKDRIIRMLIISLLITILIAVASNLAWVIYEHQYETVVETYEVEQKSNYGYNNCIIKEGTFRNGISEN